jgi:hypothetical protein
MKSPSLTCRDSGVTVVCVEHDTKPSAPMRPLPASGVMLGVALVATTLGGCVSVNAPDKPIVIELNVNIQQEVVYRLAPDAAETAKKNSSVF